MVFCQLGELS